MNDDIATIEEILKSYKDKLESISGTTISKIDVTQASNGTYNMYLKTGKRGYASLISFSMSPFPGCCGIIVSHYTYVPLELRRRGIGTLLQEIKAKIADDLGYALILCSNVDHNNEERHLLNKTDWSEAAGFVNRRTDNPVTVWFKILRQNS